MNSHSGELQFETSFAMIRKNDIIQIKIQKSAQITQKWRPKIQLGIRHFQIQHPQIWLETLDTDF